MGENVCIPMLSESHWQEWLVISEGSGIWSWGPFWFPCAGSHASSSTRCTFLSSSSFHMVVPVLCVFWLSGSRSRIPHILGFFSLTSWLTWLLLLAAFKYPAKCVYFSLWGFNRQDLCLIISVPAFDDHGSVFLLSHVLSICLQVQVPSLYAHVGEVVPGTTVIVSCVSCNAKCPWAPTTCELSAIKLSCLCTSGPDTSKFWSVWPPACASCFLCCSVTVPAPPRWSTGTKHGLNCPMGVATSLNIPSRWSVNCGSPVSPACGVNVLCLTTVSMFDPVSVLVVSSIWITKPPPAGSVIVCIPASCSVRVLIILTHTALNFTLTSSLMSAIQSPTFANLTGSAYHNIIFQILQIMLWFIHPALRAQKNVNL